MRTHIGTMGWSYKFWTGKFYPEKLKPDGFLAEYAKHFVSVEVDSTFYRIPSETTVEKWKTQTPNEFTFALKFPRVITHVKMLHDCEEQTEAFMRSASQLHPKLGPLLVQLPPQFKPNRLSTLKDFLSVLPKGFLYAVELRNKEFKETRLSTMLANRQTALVVNDLSMLDTTMLTAEFAYVRWEGDRNSVKGTLGKTEVDRTSDIESWAQKISNLGNRVTDLFGYFSKYYSGYPPDDAEQLSRLLAPSKIPPRTELN